MDGTHRSEPQGFWIEDFAGQSWFHVPAKRSWAALIFLSLWLMGWAVGEFFAIGALIAILTGKTSLGAGGVGGIIFLLIWVAFWTFGGLMAAFEWLWNLSGREVVALSGERLRLEQRVPGWTRGREFPLARIRDLRLADHSHAVPSDAPAGQLMTPGQSMLHFTYGDEGHPVTFGAGLSVSDARVMLEEIAIRQPEIVAAEFFKDYEPPAAKL